MTISVFDTIKLVQLVPNLKLSQNWLLDRFFPYSVVSDTEEIAIDVDVGKRRLAPFVSPLVEGKLVEARRVQTNVFKPAYIKDKRAPDLQRPVRRMIGETIGPGDMSPQQRAMVNVQFEMADQIDMINRRLEWMAAQALLTGTVTVTGEGFPTVVVDFGRDPTLTLTLSGAAQWGQSGVSPSWNIQEWQNQVMKLSGGGCTDIVFTPSPWQQFLQDPVVKQAIWYAGNGGAQNAVNVGAEQERGAVEMGRWGRYRLWIYNEWYVDPVTDVETPMIPDGTIIMAGHDLMGTRAFGVILDPNFAYGSMPFAPKMWVMEDPAQTLLMMQSAPLVIPSRVNACFSASVMNGVLT